MSNEVTTTGEEAMFVPHENTYVLSAPWAPECPPMLLRHPAYREDASNVPTQAFRPSRIPAPTDSLWGSRQVRGYKRKNRKPALQRFEQLKLRACHAEKAVANYARMQNYIIPCGMAYPAYGSRSYGTNSVGLHPAWYRPHIAAMRYGDAYRTHPCVLAALKITSPDNMRLLFMQQPRESDEQPGTLVYLQTYDKQSRDLWTRTSPGKYLRAMFSTLRDEEISEIVNDYAAEYNDDRFGFANTRDEMLNVLWNGPGSCMTHPTSEYQSYPHHPYEAYAPELGWRIAYMRSMPGQDAPEYFSRALVYEPHKCFVRSFRYGGRGMYSHNCPQLDAWLKRQGYEHAGEWRGARLMRIEVESGRDRFVVPYVDGNEQNVYCGSVDYFTIGRTPVTRSLLCCADSTEGVSSSAEMYECEHCGAEYDDDHDWHWAGRNEGTRICNGCYEDDYVRVIGRGGDTYIVHEDDAVRCETDDTYYHDDYLDENDVYQCAYDDHYYKASEMFECAHSGYRYHEDVDHICMPGGDCVALTHASRYFAGDTDRFVEWWQDGARTNSGTPYSLLRQFIGEVEGDPTALADDDDLWTVYTEVCDEEGRTPIDRPSDDDDDAAVDETNTTEGA